MILLANLVGIGGGIVHAASVTTFSKTYGGSDYQQANSVIQTSDGGYAVAGYTDASGAGSTNFYLIKTTSTGATSKSSAFNWGSLEGFLIIGAIIFIVLGVVLFIMARTRKSTSYPHQ